MYNKLPIESQNKPIEYLNEIQYNRSIDLSTALNKWYYDFLNSDLYNKLIQEYNIINYSEFFIINEDFKFLELVNIYNKVPTANNQIKLLEFLFGTGNEIKIKRLRHKHLQINITKTTDTTATPRNLVTTDITQNITTEPDPKNIVVLTQKFRLTDPNLVNLFFLITNFNCKYDLTITDSENVKSYYNYEFNHNPTLTL
jgi:hypothetical protein